MALTQDHINSRIVNLRQEAVAAVKAINIHTHRLAKTTAGLEVMLEELEMFSSTPRAKVSEADRAFDAEMFSRFATGDWKNLLEHVTSRSEKQ